MPDTLSESGGSRSQEESLTAILPLIRVVRARAAMSFDTIQEVLAVYEDRLVVFRKKTSVPIPPEAYEPGQEEALGKVKSKGRRAEIAVADIATAWVSGPLMYGSRWLSARDEGRKIRVMNRAGAYVEVWIPEDEAQMVMVVLRRLLGDRYTEKADLDPRPRDAIDLLGKGYSRTRRFMGGLLISGVLLTTLGVHGLNAKWGIAPLFMLLSMPLWIAAWILFVVIVAHALGNPQSEYKKKQRAAKRRAKEVQEDLSGKPPLRSRGWGAVLKVCGALALVAGFAAAVVVVQNIPEQFRVAGVRQLANFAFILCYLPATCLIYYGYRLGLRRAEDVRQADPRSPVLYLRPFAVDANTNFNPKGFLAQVFGLEAAGILRGLGPLGNVNPVRLVRLLFRPSADYAEEQLAGFLGGYGPFVAIGKPGERLAMGGAARFYVKDEEWREVVGRLVREATIIVLEPGESEQVWWEICEAFRNTQPQNVLFSLLSLEQVQWRYERFRLRFERELQRKLPRFLGSGVFLYFTADEAQLLPARRRPHVAWPLAGCAIDFPRTLAPFLANRAGGRAPIAPEAGAFRRFVGATFGAAIWLLAVTSVTYGGSVLVSALQVRMEASRLAAAGRKAPLVSYEGSAALPYQLRLPGTWKPVKFKLPPTARMWQLGEVANCVVVAEPRVEGMPANTSDYAKLMVKNFWRTMHSSEVLGQETVLKDEREWQITHLRCRGGGGLLSAAAVNSGAFYVSDAQMVFTVWNYAGPDGCLQVAVGSLESAAPILQPLLQTVFSNFSLENPTAIRRRVEAAEHERLVKSESESASAVGQGIERRTYADPGGKYAFTLGSNWQPVVVEGLEMSFALGERIGLGVTTENLDGASKPPTKEEYARVILVGVEQAIGSSFKIEDRSVVMLAGKEWVRIRYRGAPLGVSYQFTMYCLVTAHTALRIVGSSDFVTAEAHDQLIGPGVAGFTLGRRRE